MYLRPDGTEAIRTVAVTATGPTAMATARAAT